MIPYLLLMGGRMTLRQRKKGKDKYRQKLLNLKKRIKADEAHSQHILKARTCNKGSVRFMRVQNHFKLMDYADQSQTSFDFERSVIQNGLLCKIELKSVTKPFTCVGLSHSFRPLPSFKNQTSITNDPLTYPKMVIFWTLIQEPLYKNF